MARNVGRLWRWQGAARWLALAVAVALLVPDGTSAVPLAAFSPLVAACSALATRSVGFVVLLGLPMLLLAFLVPRWFCRFACPVGLLQETLGLLRPGAKNRWMRWPIFGRWFALLTLAGAVLGCPLFVWLDPLAIFSSFFGVWRQPLTWAGVCAGLALPLALVFDLCLPKAWCMRVCPLGALQDLLVIGKQTLRPRTRSGTESAAERRGAWTLIPVRRSFLAVCLGAAGAIAVRKVRGAPPPLRPPGALDEERFTGVCVRCGSCVRVCPTRILCPDLGARSLAGFLAPVARFDDGYCREDCHRCGLVCPSGAIARLSLAEKRRRVIGPAQVDLDTCLLANGRDCTACIRACPYEALQVLSDGFDTRPELDLARCTGCGACEAECPVRPQRAIRVRPQPGVLPPRPAAQNGQR